MVDYARFRAGAQWMQDAMAGETEHVPVYAQLHEFVAAQLQIPGKVFYTRPDINVGATTPPENVRAAVEAAHR